MTHGDWIALAVLVASILGTFLVLVFKIGGLHTIIVKMEPLVDKIPAMEVKVTELWRFRMANNDSPMVLNDKGLIILKESGINELVDLNYHAILSKVRNLSPPNAYQAQETIVMVVKELINDPILKNNIEAGAYKSGVDVETVLFVGALYIRDKILQELNLIPANIDNDDPSKKIPV